MEEIMNEIGVATKLFEIMDDLPDELLDRIILVCNIILATRNGEFD